MPAFKTKDNVQLYYKDWGEGLPIIFLHAYAVTSDLWDYQMLSLVRSGLRCVAYDRRGFGRSDHPGLGYDFDTLSDDLAALLAHLDLKRAVLVGHSMGAGEIARYLARYGSARVACAVFVSPITPFLIRTADHQAGLDPSILDSLLAAIALDFPNTLKQLSTSFWGDAESVSQPMKDWVYQLGLQTSLIAAQSCLRTSWQTDFRKDLSAIDIPVLVIQGDQDQIVPLNLTGQPTAAAISQAELLVYKGIPHGLPLIAGERFKNDLQQFINLHILKRILAKTGAAD